VDQFEVVVLDADGSRLDLIERGDHRWSRVVGTARSDSADFV
jgi:hypothetical protein